MGERRHKMTTTLRILLVLMITLSLGAAMVAADDNNKEEQLSPYWGEAISQWSWWIIHWARERELDPDLVALAQAVQEGRLRIDARRRGDLRSLLRLIVRSLAHRPVLAGVTEGHALIPELKRLGCPVVYEMPIRLRGGYPSLGENPDRLRPRSDTPRLLAKAEIPFALTPEPGSERDLRLMAALAVRGGLDRQQDQTTGLRTESSGSGDT